MTQRLPPDIEAMLLGSERIIEELNLLRSKGRLVLRDLRRIAVLQSELAALCPPERYIWRAGRPVADILKTLQN